MEGIKIFVCVYKTLTKFIVAIGVVMCSPAVILVHALYNTPDTRGRKMRKKRDQQKRTFDFGKV